MTATSNESKNAEWHVQIEKRRDEPIRRVLKRIRQAIVVVSAMLFVLFAATQIYFYSGSKEYNYVRFNANSSVNTYIPLVSTLYVNNDSIYVNSRSP